MNTLMVTVMLAVLFSFGLVSPHPSLAIVPEVQAEFLSPASECTGPDASVQMLPAPVEPVILALAECRTPNCSQEGGAVPKGTCKRQCDRSCLEQARSRCVTSCGGNSSPCYSQCYTDASSDCCDEVCQ